jgi:hypothetical protein
MIDSLSQMLMTIGAVAAIIGACRIYYLWSNGKTDIDREVVMWVGGIFLLMMSTVVVKLMLSP